MTGPVSYPDFNDALAKAILRPGWRPSAGPSWEPGPGWAECARCGLLSNPAPSEGQP